ncbi:MAG: hypothetical protein Q8N88_05950 [Nanoarchaeota archaeon]|nr:hypothetical protein [Nanoarchaeota archaeon]
MTYNSIKDYFEQLHLRKYFTAEELFFQFRLYEPDLNQNTFRWRVHELKKKSIIRDVMWGVYSRSDKPYFEPIITNDLKKVSGIFAKKYPEISYCIWTSRWLNDLIIHQIVRHFIILETENDVVENTFYHFQEKGLNVFLKPDKETIERYVLPKEDSIVIISLVTRSPALIAESIDIPSIEKILVDVFCDKETFFLYSGGELKNIFRFALKKYSINFSRLFAYADRRMKKEEIRSFIFEYVDKSLIQIINDKL